DAPPAGFAMACFYSNQSRFKSDLRPIKPLDLGTSQAAERRDGPKGQRLFARRFKQLRRLCHAQNLNVAVRLFGPCGVRHRILGAPSARHAKREQSSEPESICVAA